MSSIKQLKSRIKSVKGTKQTTKAMELVASSKLRRAQESTVASRNYADSAAEVLTRLSQIIDIDAHPLYSDRKVVNRLIVLITSDRGLAGAYNSNVIKQAISQIKTARDRGEACMMICLGRKGAQFASKIEGLEVVAAYEGLPETPTADTIRPILRQVIGMFLDDKVQAVDIITTRFENSVNQVAVSVPLLPAGFKEVSNSDGAVEAVFEPSLPRVLEVATERLLEAQIFQSILDARASEHSMRRVAMKNATDNAGEIVGDLTLEMNKVRQAAITQELAEISGGVEALK